MRNNAMHVILHPCLLKNERREIQNLLKADSSSIANKC
jgi:hypothetical protein